MKNGDRMDQVAEWMARYGGSLADCARSLGLSYRSVESAWERIRRGLGWQAI